MKRLLKTIREKCLGRHEMRANLEKHRSEAEAARAPFKCHGELEKLLKLEVVEKTLEGAAWPLAEHCRAPPTPAKPHFCPASSILCSPCLVLVQFPT